MDFNKLPGPFEPNEPYDGRPRLCDGFSSLKVDVGESDDSHVQPLGVGNMGACPKKGGKHAMEVDLPDDKEEDLPDAKKEDLTDAKKEDLTDAKKDDLPDIDVLELTDAKMEELRVADVKVFNAYTRIREMLRRTVQGLGRAPRSLRDLPDWAQPMDPQERQKILIANRNMPEGWRCPRCSMDNQLRDFMTRLAPELTSYDHQEFCMHKQNPQQGQN